LIKITGVLFTMKKIASGSLVGILLSSSLFAGTMGDAQTNPWFFAIGTGYSWTMMPGIENPNPSVWDASFQGYDNSLGNRGFLTFELGKQVHPLIDVSVMSMMHETFNYQKFQSGSPGTPDFTGAQRNRYFNLNNKSILFNAFLHPESFWQCHELLYRPYISAGIGYAYSYMNNFYTVGNQVEGPGLPNVGSTDSIGTPVSTNAFAWQGSAGVSFRTQSSPVSFNTGYRYYNGGQFNGPTSVFTNANGFVNATAWSGILQANQWFVEFQYTFD
jgi:hypothetical protein